MWNERYLHIDSNHKDYSLYSKKTIGVSFLKDKHVSNMIMYFLGNGVTGRKQGQYAPFSVNVRMYFSRCYIIENDNTHGENLHVHLYTYRGTNSCLRLSYSPLSRQCGCNVLPSVYVLFPPKVAVGLRVIMCRQLIKDAVLYGASVLCLIASMTTFITYLERHTLWVFLRFHSLQIPPRRARDQGECFVHDSLHSLLLLLPRPLLVVRSSHQSELLPHLDQRVQLRSSCREFLRPSGLPVSVLGRGPVHGSLVLYSSAESRRTVDVGGAGIRFAGVFDDVRNGLAVAESYQRNRYRLDAAYRSAVFVEKVGAERGR